MTPISLTYVTILFWVTYPSKIRIIIHKVFNTEVYALLLPPIVLSIPISFMNHINVFWVNRRPHLKFV